VQVAAILIADELHPVEFQQWLDDHATVTILHIVVQNDVFYVVYQN